MGLRSWRAVHDFLRCSATLPDGALHSQETLHHVTLASSVSGLQHHVTLIVTCANLYPVILLVPRLVFYLFYCPIIKYFFTRLSSWEGWYRKSTNQIARLPVWYFPSIRPVSFVSDQESNFSKWRMQRRSRFANVLLKTQSNSCPGDEGPHFELGLDIGRPEAAAEHENGEVITNSSWASRFYRRT